MDPLSLMIYIAIGNMVAWLAALYVKGALPGLIGHVIVSTLGAAGTAYLILRFAPAVNGIGIVGGALVGAAVLLYVTLALAGLRLGSGAAPVTTPTRPVPSRNRQAGAAKNFYGHLWTKVDIGVRIARSIDDPADTIGPRIPIPSPLPGRLTSPPSANIYSGGFKAANATKQ